MCLRVCGCAGVGVCVTGGNSGEDEPTSVAADDTLWTATSAPVVGSTTRAEGSKMLILPLPVPRVFILPGLQFEDGQVCGRERVRGVAVHSPRHFVSSLSVRVRVCFRAPCW